MPFDRLRVMIVAYHDQGVEVAALEPGAPLVVGRSPARGLRVDHPTLSREHARFTLVRDRVLVEDLGSKNGVRWGAARRAGRAHRWATTCSSGAVRVRAHVLGSGGESLALMGEEPFRVDVETERARAAQFGRPFALLLVRAVPRAAPDPRVAARASPWRTARPARARRHARRSTRRAPLPRPAHGAREPGAIPKDLLESTPGHERGAFTGARSSRRACGGRSRHGVLRRDRRAAPRRAGGARAFLESGAFCRVGSSREIAVDVRVIAATHRDLEAMAASGAFRADLYYRLGGVVIEIPPLRARRDEVEPLAMRFLRMANEANARSVEGFEPEGHGRAPPEIPVAGQRARAAQHGRSGSGGGGPGAPPSALLRAAGACPRACPRARPRGRRRRSSTRGRDTPPPGDDAPGPVRDKVQGYEARVLREALEAAGWNRNLVANKLGMPVRTLAYRMKVLGIKKARSRIAAASSRIARRRCWAADGKLLAPYAPARCWICRGSARRLIPLPLPPDASRSRAARRGPRAGPGLRRRRRRSSCNANDDVQWADELSLALLRMLDGEDARAQKHSEARPKIDCFRV